MRQLTRYRGHSCHSYFTALAWFDGGRRLAFASDRHGLTQLFSLDLTTGAITQLTDRSPPPTGETYLSMTPTFCVNPIRAEAYWWYGRELLAVDLRSLAERTLYEVPQDCFGGLLACTADGQSVCTTIVQDLTRNDNLLPRFATLPLEWHIYLREWDRAYLETPPLSRIVRIAADGVQAEVIWEEHYFLGHAVPSPTHPHVLFFAHEAPWHLVDHMLWGLDWQEGKAWQIRPQRPREQVGHPYWLHDGEHVGYHGRTADGQHMIGFIRYDNTDQREAVVEVGSMHMHSHDGRLIVGDGRRLTMPYLLLWRWEGEQIEGPRTLCWHRGSSHTDQVHVHPMFTPDGSSVLFVSDNSGYGKLYLVEVPEFATLPAVEERG